MKKTTSQDFGYRTGLQGLFLLFAALFLASCSNEAFDGGDANYQAPFVQGTYHLTVMQSNDPSDFNKGGETSFNLVEEMDCLQVTLRLYADGTLESTYTDLQVTEDPATGKYRFSCGKELRSSGTYTVTGSKVKMDTATFTIYGDQLIDARKPEAELFDLVVFTRQP